MKWLLLCMESHLRTILLYHYQKILLDKTLLEVPLTGKLVYK